MRDAQTLTVDKHAALFEHCDIFIDTDDDAWTLIVVNPKARAVVDQAIAAKKAGLRVVIYEFGGNTSARRWKLVDVVAWEIERARINGSLS